MASSYICCFLLSAFALVRTITQEVDSTVTIDKLSIARLIDDTVENARNGVENNALRISLAVIHQLADSYLNERGAIVDAQEVINVVGIITTNENWQFILSAFLEDPLVQEERKVTVGLFVLKSLSLGIRAEDNDTEVNVLVAAVSVTAKSVERSVSIGDILYNYKEETKSQLIKRVLFIGYGHGFPGFYEHRYSNNVDNSDLKRKRWSASGSASSGSGSSSSSSSSGRDADALSEYEFPRLYEREDRDIEDNTNLKRKRWSASGSASGGSGGSSSSSSSSSGRDLESLSDNPAGFDS